MNKKMNPDTFYLVQFTRAVDASPDDIGKHFKEITLQDTPENGGGYITTARFNEMFAETEDYIEFSPTTQRPEMFAFIRNTFQEALSLMRIHLCEHLEGEDNPYVVALDAFAKKKLTSQEHEVYGVMAWDNVG